MPFLDKKNKKLILESKLKGQLNLTLPLILNQTERVKDRVGVLIMRINKWIHGGPIFKVNNAKICKEIGAILPEHEMIYSNAKFIQKLMYQKETVSIKNHIVILNRSTSILYHRNPKKKSYRTALEHHINMYNQLPAKIKLLKPN